MQVENLLVIRINSPLGSNALFCCQRYGFDLELFRLHSVSLDNKFFINWYKDRVTEVEALNAMSLIELLFEPVRTTVNQVIFFRF